MVRTRLLRGAQRLAWPLRVCAALWLLAAPAPAAAHANLVRAEPAAGTAVRTAPVEVRLWFSERAEARYSEIAVYDAARRRYDTGEARPVPGDPLALAVGLGELPPGNYSVVWKANSAVDGHTTSGSFAFAVGDVPPPPPDPNEGITTFTPPTPAEVATRWLALLAATVFTGALGLSALVWTPVLRRAGLPETAPGGAFERRVGRRLALLAGAALLLLALATLVGLVLQAAKAAGRTPGGALDAALLGDFLLNTRGGGIWSVRLLLPVVAALLLGPVVAGAWRPRAVGDGIAGATLPGLPALFGVALGMCYLLTISLISHGAASPLWTPFTIALDWVHLLGTAVWVGGLAGLALTVPALPALGARARPVALAVVARFSTIALGSVVVLALTGLYSAWLHVGALDALLPTAYGRTLAVKLALVAGMVALGAFNMLWVRGRLAAGEAAGGRLLRLFGRAVRAEATLGAATLLAVALLTGLAPAREAIVQARAPKRAVTAVANDLRVTLTLASLQPGENRFDVALKDRAGRPVSDAQKVALRITHAEMDMGEAEAVAEPRGDGHYAVSGPYLSMSGAWTVRVIVRRAGLEDAEATYRFPIGATANLATAPTAPALPRLTRERGIGIALLLAAAALAGAGVPLFRRGSGLGTALLMLVPTAVVVGGYLIYSDTGSTVRRAVEPANPAPVTDASLTRGEQLFAANCVVCHGPRGRGDGPSAATLNPRPPDLADPHTAVHSDGYLFNVITGGVPGSAMPAWAGQIAEQDRWHLVNYLRQFNPLTARGGGATRGTPAAATVRASTPPAAATGVRTRAAGTPASPTTPPAMVGNGRLIYALDGKLWSLDPAGGEPVNLTPNLPKDTFVAEPALSPDGTTLAYTSIVVPPIGAGAQSPRALPGSDLYLMNLDGSGAREVFKHDRPGVLITRPSWTPDGRALVYAYSAPVLGADGRYTGAIREVQRLDLASGARAPLLQDAEDASLAPPGAVAGLVYVRTDRRTFTQELWLAGADGGEGRKLLGAEPGFTAFAGARFSPDGRRVLFAAVGGPGVGLAPPAPGGSLPGRLRDWLVAPFDPPPVGAHGPPWDLWTVALDGGDLRRVTELFEDSPLGTWSPDGQRIAMLAGGGVYVIGADGRGLVKVSPKGGHGPIVWAPR